MRPRLHPISSRRCDGQEKDTPLSCQFWGGLYFSLWFQPSKNTSQYSSRLLFLPHIGEVNIGAWVNLKHLCWCWHQSPLVMLFPSKNGCKKPAILGWLKVGLKKNEKNPALWWTLVVEPVFFLFLVSLGIYSLNCGRHRWWRFRHFAPRASPGRWSGFARTWQSSGNGEVIGSRAMGVCWGFG